MTYTLGQLAEVVGGTLLDPADRDLSISAAMPFHSAVASSITFLSRDRRISVDTPCGASAVIVDRGRGSVGVPTIEVDQPLDAMLLIAELFQPKLPVSPPGVHATAVVDPSATIDPTASIGPYVVIEAHVKVGARTTIHSHTVVRAYSILGDEVTLHPHVVLYPFTEVGDRTVLHSGVILGCDGFGYKPNHPVHLKVPQLGNVVVSTDVEIGANSTIDRATLGSTTIGMSTKIDNQVMIGHNCQIGPRNIMAAHTGLSGSCKTGDMVWMAGKVGLADHLTIGDGALLLAGSGVARDIKPGERVVGSPARPFREFAVEQAALSKVPGLLREFREWRRKQNEPKDGDRKCA
jgi:UDP-3-O-[3-hydroxymyristoyl] glucosamine N-acyltransferase